MAQVAKSVARGLNLIPVLAWKSVVWLCRIVHLILILVKFGDFEAYIQNHYSTVGHLPSSMLTRVMRLETQNFFFVSCFLNAENWSAWQYRLLHLNQPACVNRPLHATQPVKFYCRRKAMRLLLPGLTLTSCLVTSHKVPNRSSMEIINNIWSSVIVVVATSMDAWCKTQGVARSW